MSSISDGFNSDNMVGKIGKYLKLAPDEHSNPSGFIGGFISTSCNRLLKAHDPKKNNYNATIASSLMIDLFDGGIGGIITQAGSENLDFEYNTRHCSLTLRGVLRTCLQSIP